MGGVRAVSLAAALALAPLGARSADFVVWWEEGYYHEEDEAVRELIAAFAAETGKTVELVLHPPAEQPKAVQTAIAAGSPPDFLFGIWVQDQIERWAFEGRLVDLTGAVQPLAGLFDADLLARLARLRPQSLGLLGAPGDLGLGLVDALLRLELTGLLLTGCLGHHGAQWRLACRDPWLPRHRLV